MRRVHRLLRAGLLTLGVLGGFSFAVSPALAGTGPGPLSGSFGSETSTVLDPYPLSLSGTAGVAVDDVTHDVYVADAGNNRVEKFDSTGHFLMMFGGNVGGPDLDTCTSTCSTGTPGSGEGQFNDPAWIAVDNSGTGDVYVADEGNHRVEKFTSGGVYVSQIPVDKPLDGIAVDPSGDLWVVQENGEATEYSSTGSFVKSIHTCGSSPGLAVDANELYIGCYAAYPQAYAISEAGHSEVIETVKNAGNEIRATNGVAVDTASGELFFDLGLSSATTLIQEIGTSGRVFGSGILTAPGSGIAVDSVNGDLYVADPAGDLVDLFGGGATPEKPKTEPAKVEGPHSATLNGELTGGESGYEFAYNDNGTCKGGARTSELAAAGTAKESALVEGLEPNTEYTYCILAIDEFGGAPGLPASFRTLGVPPVIVKVGSSDLAPTEATLEATIDPEKQVTTCAFEYAKSGEPYKPRVRCEPPVLDLGEVSGNQSASLRLKGLQPSTTYEYRVVVSNQAGEAKLAGTAFTTPAEPTLPPTIEAESVSVESVVGAGREVTFTARVNPNLEETTSCVFEYGETEGYGEKAPCEPSQHFGKVSDTGVDVHAKVNGLVAGADYHYRVVVGNETGTTEGKDQVFGPPTVLSEAPGIAPSTTAPIGGEVNPEELDTHYYVQYGETGAYGQIAPSPLRSAEEELNGVYPAPVGLDAGSGGVSVVLGSSSGITCGLPCQGPPDIPLESLTPGATYHYRLVAYNGDGTTYGVDETVTVLPAPQVGPASVSEVTQSSATISTSVNPEGLHTLYELEVGTSAAYGTPHPGDAGSGSAPVALTFHLSGLKAGDTYHFRLKASNSDGESSEADQTFTTAAAVVEAPLELIKPPLELGLVSFTAKAFPTEPKPTTTKALTRAQKLANALKACKRKAKSKRAACVKQARKRYGPVKKAKK